MTQSERETERWRDCEAKKIGKKDTVNRFLRNNEICKFHYIQCIVSSESNDLSPNARLSLSVIMGVVHNIRCACAAMQTKIQRLTIAAIHRFTSTIFCGWTLWKNSE